MISNDVHMMMRHSKIFSLLVFFFFLIIPTGVARAVYLLVSQSDYTMATNHPANTPDSPESPRFLLRESPPDQPVAAAPVFEGAAG